MIAIVFTVQADAVALASSMDTRTGPYPKSGTDIGGGIHVPPSQSQTVRYGSVVQHPAQLLWRYPDDATVQAEIVKGLAIPASGSVQPIDATWFPADATPQTAQVGG